MAQMTLRALAIERFLRSGESVKAHKAGKGMTESQSFTVGFRG